MRNREMLQWSVMDKNSEVDLIIIEPEAEPSGKETFSPDPLSSLAPSGGKGSRVRGLIVIPRS